MRYLFILMLSALPALLCAEENNPAAHPKSMISLGHARFTVLTPSLIRMEWSASRQFEDRADFTIIKRALPVPRFSHRTTKNKLTIRTQNVILTYFDNGKPFDAQNLQARFLLNGKEIRWTPGKKDSLNLKGTTRTVDQSDSVSAAMLEDGIISRSGWALVDNSRQLLFDDGNPGWVTSRTDTTALDLYLFAYGHRYKKALADYTKIAGRIPMPPKYAFGYWYSRYFCYSDAEIEDMVAEMKRFDIPIDVFIVDMDWHKTYGISALKGNFTGWTGYSWEKNLFPDPEGFLSRMRSSHLKVSLNLHPADGIYHRENCFAAFAKALGKDTAGMERFPFLLEDKKWANAYFTSVIRPLEKQGVDFWWLDWQQWKYSKTIPRLNNIWWLNYAFFTDMERNRETRPLLFHRWGGLGNHRYQVGFSGDSHATFKMLSTLPYFTSTASNVGYGYWSHDIGGHIQNYPATDPELYLRWIQFGVFSPILRTHSSKQGNIERRIWKFPNFNQMNDALHLRYALAPYIYTAAREAYDDGISICRPLYYDYPEQEDAYRAQHQYLFGNDLLVAPVTKPADTEGLTEQSIWLPSGEWYDMSSGTLCEGNRQLKNEYTHGEIPWFAKAGSILPMNPAVRNLQEDPQHVVFVVIPGKSGKGTLYEDEGDSQSYIRGEFAFTRISQLRRDRQITIDVSPRTGQYKGMSTSRAYTFKVLACLPPKLVKVNGTQYPYSRGIAEQTWSYDATNTELIITLPRIRCQSVVQVEIECVTDNDLQFTNGLKGLFNRLKSITFEVKSEISKNDWARSPSELFLSVSQTPSKVKTNPESATAEFARFRVRLNQALDELKLEFGISDSLLVKYRRWLL